MGANLSGDYKWSGIATGPDGKLYCAPFSATDILVITPDLPLGLYFKAPQSTIYYSLPGGVIVRRLDLGPVDPGDVSEPKPVAVENRTEMVIHNVTIDVESHPPGDEVQLSLTADPFVPEELPLQLPGTVEHESETQPVYVRVKVGAQSQAGQRVVGLTVSAESL